MHSGLRCHQRLSGGVPNTPLQPTGGGHVVAGAVDFEPAARG